MNEETVMTQDDIWCGNGGHDVSTNNLCELEPTKCVKMVRTDLLKQLLQQHLERIDFFNKDAQNPRHPNGQLHTAMNILEANIKKKFAPLLED